MIGAGRSAKQVFVLTRLIFEQRLDHSKKYPYIHLLGFFD